MQKPRQQRVHEFASIQGGVLSSFSVHLFTSAYYLLELAHAQGEKEAAEKGTSNHWSFYAPGSICLLVNGFEVWINESIQSQFFFEADVKKALAELPLVQRFYRIPESVNAVMIPENPDLITLVELRNEITHFLPRVTTPQGAIPNWFQDLEAKGLFITTGKPEGEYTYIQKLASYWLCYWAWEVVSSAAEAYVDALGTHTWSEAWTKGNIDAYKALPRPTGIPF